MFILLETLFSAFDETSRNFGVFKVESVGDCCKWVNYLVLNYRSHRRTWYTDVAAAGIPGKVSRLLSTPITDRSELYRRSNP